ncbi:hypothetical protein QIW49_07770 [Francisellaceae bacterium CB300]
MNKNIVQLDLFDFVSKSKKIGRPVKIDKEKIFTVKDDLNKGLSNKLIMKKNNIKERTFFRIKKGDYDDLFKDAIKASADDFKLVLTE